MVLSKNCGWRLAVSVITLATITLITFSSRVLQMKINFTPTEMDIQKTYRIAWYNIIKYPYLNPSKYDPSMCSIKNCFVEET